MVSNYEPYERVLEDTVLRLMRTDDVIVIQVISKKRPEEAKVAFYKSVFNNLNAKLNIREEDLLISIVENTSVD
ncbi:tautomerase family protein [Priestia sp. 179-F W1.4 NHS]|uniref:tautomerase family protein n=1 Tax=Priestia sp. 179-F W1.4 NHS TaxID=3374296 RepID=UPI00387A5469